MEYPGAPEIGYSARESSVGGEEGGRKYLRARAHLLSRRSLSRFSTARHAARAMTARPTKTPRVFNIITVWIIKMDVLYICVILSLLQGSFNIYFLSFIHSVHCSCTTFLRRVVLWWDFSTFCVFFLVILLFVFGCYSHWFSARLMVNVG